MAKAKSGAQAKSGAASASSAKAASTPVPSSTDLQPLVERLRAGRAILCAGRHVGIEGDFRSLVERLLAALPDTDTSEAKQVLERRPLAAAGFVKRRLGERFAVALQALTPTGGDLPQSLKTLGDLPFRAVLTTSYGDLYERAFTKDGQAPKVLTPADHEELRALRGRYILKVLGEPRRPETIVFSSEDLQGALADGNFRSVTQDLYRSRSFVFVGWKANDPDLGMLLERVLAGARSSDVEHFALLPEVSTIEKEELWAAYRVRVLDVDTIEKLAAQLKEQVGEMKGPQLPDDDDLEAWLGLLGEDPTRTDAQQRLDALETKLRERSDWDTLVELYLGRAGIEATAQRRGHFLLSVARLFENEVGDLQKAFTALLAAYKEDPQQTTFSELERLASATGMWTELLSELAEIVPTLPDKDRAAAWIRIARLYGDKLGHAQYALTSLDEALRLQPEGADLLAAQEMRISLLRRLEKWPELAEALAERAKVETVGTKRAELYLEQADLYEARIGDGAQAVTAYRMAMAADPKALDAPAALEALLRRRGEHAPLVELLGERVKTAAGDEALAIRREVAEILAEKLNDKKSAIERYEAIVKDEPKDLPSLRALERLYVAVERHEDYLKNLQQQSDAVEGDKERATILRRLASEWEEHPGGGPRAAEQLERLLQLDPRSEDAFRSLERIYRAHHEWKKLIEALRRHAGIVPQPIRAELFAQVGAVYEQELKDAPRAIEAFREVETILPEHGEALLALSRLFEKTEAWSKAVEVLVKRAETAEVKVQKVDLFHKAGVLTAERLLDAKAAEALFMRALEIDPTHVPSMTASVEIYRKNGEFLKASRLLVEAVPHTNNRLEKTRLLVEAGEIYQSLDDAKKATELYLAALEVDPEHVEAGERVADLLWKAERHAELVPILEMLTRKEVPPHVQVERLLRLSKASAATGAGEKVLRALGRIVEIDPLHEGALGERARLLIEASDWKEARAALEPLFVHHLKDMPPSRRVELFYRIGLCELRMSNANDARKWLTRALEVDPTHRPTLLLQMETGDAKPESMVDAKKALLATASPDEKVRLLTEIGDLYSDKLKDDDKAIGAYREALEIRPEERRLLHRCLDKYVEKKEWANALEILERLIGIEKEVNVRAKYRLAAAQLCRDELGKPEVAAKLYTEALDDDPNLPKAGAELEALLTERQEWKELARFYRRTLKRLGAETSDGKNDERLRVWAALGQICLEQLGERESAIAALEVALSFDKNNADRMRQLADLYIEGGPEHLEKAIVAHQQLLRSEKQRIASYRGLRFAYLQTGQRDRAASASYALVFLKKGEADDQRVVQELKARPLVQARRPLNDELWQKIAHPDEDRLLNALFTAIAPALALAQAQPHKNLGLQRKEALDPNDGRPLARALKYVSTILSVAPPEIYLRPDQKEAVTVQVAIDGRNLVPVFLVGQPLLGDKKSERELHFDLARRLTLLRPERFIRSLFAQAPQLNHVIEAVFTLAGDAATQDHARTVDVIKRTLQPAQFEQVVAIAKRLKATGQKPEQIVAGWLAATDLTATRIGFILLGDLELSARLLASDAAPVGALATTQRLLDLIWSSVTEEVFAVRKHLGLLQ